MKDKVIDFAIEHGRATFLFMFAIIVFGVVARLTIPVENEPRVDVPVFVVTIPHEGISPDDGTRLLISPLELELKGIEGIKEVTGTGAEHVAIVTVEFSAATDPDIALNDLREAVNRARAEMPSSTDEPIVETIDNSTLPVVQINLVGDEGTSEKMLFDAAVALQRHIETLPRVRRADLQGVREEFLEVVVDPNKLHSHEISVEGLIGALGRNNQLIPAGALVSGKGSISIKIPSVIESTEDLLDLPVKANSASVITLSDVATIRRTFKDRTSYNHANGEQCISIFVVRRPEEYLIQTAKEVKQMIEEYRSNLPKSIKLFYSLDNSIFAEKQVVELQGNMVTSLVLVMIVLFSTMGVRSSLVVGVAIPFTFLFTLIFLWLFQMSFNFMVMFGMLLGLGMLIDGVIVVTEDAERRISSGVRSVTAFSAAAKRMFLPVTASTATTLAAFFPLIFWPGVAGQFMGHLPKTLFLVLLGALVYTVFIAPLLGSTISRQKRRDTTASDTMESMWDMDLASLTGFKRVYSKLLASAVKYSGITVILIIVTIIGIFMYHGSKNLGVLFFNENDPQYARVLVRAQGNLSVEEAYELAKEVEAEILSVPGIENLNMFSTNGVEMGKGLRTSAASGSSPDLIATFFIEMYGSDKRDETGVEILEQIIEKTGELGGIIVEVIPFQGELGQGKPITIQFLADERERLIPVVSRVRNFMDSEVEGLRSIEDTLPQGGIEWKLTVDREAAALYGADATTVGLAAQLVTTGVKLGEYRPDDADDALDIRIRYPDEYRDTTLLDEMDVITNQGPVPVSHFVERTAQTKLSNLQRRNQKNLHLIRADVAPGVLANTKVQEIEIWIQGQRFDPLVDIRFRGAQEEQEESIGFIGKAFSFALVLMFALLVLQYNSFYQSFLTMIAIIFSTAGVFLGLALTNQPFSAILSGVGVLALAGIVVNNNIVLIDTFNNGVKENPDKDVATIIVLTGLQRLRPVLLTTGTTIIGLLPLATNNSVDFINRTWTYGGVLSQYWVPLAQAIVFGLTFATVLTLVITPALLIIPSQLKKWSMIAMERFSSMGKLETR